MNIRKTKEYYTGLTDRDLCQCAFCRTYAKEIRTSLPHIAEYLDSIGVDIEKPFEVIPVDEYTDYMEYTGAQYIVFGEHTGFKETVIDGIYVVYADSHPADSINEKHFVIEIQAPDLIRLKKHKS